MSGLNIKDIAEKGGGVLFSDIPTFKTSGLSVDSRLIEKGNLFIALKGPNFDGHNFLTEAGIKGASAFVVEKRIESKKPYILVKSTYKFLDLLAKEQRKAFKGQIIGLTGSNGKTTTKEIVYHLLSTQGKCHKTQGNQNNHIGVPLSLSSIEKDFNFSVIEIGTNSPGEIDRLSKMTRPDIALITNAAASHLKGLGSLKAVAKEKGSILQNIKDNGAAVLPRDSEFYPYWKSLINHKRLVTFGFNEDSDIMLRNSRVDLFNNSTFFEVSFRGKEFKFSMNGLGTQNSLNACAALAVGVVLDLDLYELSSIFSNILLPDRRLSSYKGMNGSTLIDDSYNSNPHSMKAAIDVISNLSEKKSIFVAGQMGELGRKEQKFHTEICKYAKDKIDMFLCVGSLWIEGLEYLGNMGKIFESNDDLFHYLAKVLDKNSVVVVKGSRFTNMDVISDKLKGY